MSTRQKIRDIISVAKEHISIMSGRYRVSPTDFDELYQLYQLDTSAKGLYEFIVDHPVTHAIAGRLNVRPIDVLATMVGKTAEVCQKELDAGRSSSTKQILMYQDAEAKAARHRAKTMAEARSASVSESTLKGAKSLQVSYEEGKVEMEMEA
ncbi:uncharacterized protein F4812DRAFT_455202 [Daldinia caldariorum]|uniref:uncharacterized protein n=1 Tax=Daldinia caldariorum TaxID=326644 RepID=UPI0020086B7D|nr:uncharacterized protein F4812DRAFT_455202 [Daldinia caldariorum]KAI1471090.1 hypothetical protein F4812DRAFT_455202 [Daldinia caldariorum]